MGKVIKALKEGKFWFRLKTVMRQKKQNAKRLYVIKDDRVKELQEQARWLKKFQKKYRKTIEAGVQNSNQTGKSNKVWMLWFSGFESAPPIVKACYYSVKKNMPDREVIFLSESNVSDYIELPDYILKKRKKQLIGLAHFADIIRIQLLCTHGGMWIDSTVLCTASSTDFKKIIDAPLFLYHDVLDEHVRRASNWLIVNNGNGKVLSLTRELLFRYWKDYNYSVNYLFLDLLMALASRRYPEEWNSMPPYNNYDVRVMQKEMLNEFSLERWNEYLKMASFHKLTYKPRGDNPPNSTFNYIIKTYLEDSQN